MGGGRHEHPEARADGLLIEHLDGEMLVYDTASDQAHQLNDVAAAVFARADGRTAEQEIADVVSDDLGRPVDTAAVADALTLLAERDLLAGENGVSRRDALRRAAYAGAGAVAAVPVIKSIVAPTAAVAATCTPNSQPCDFTNPAACCSQCCVNPGDGNFVCCNF